MYSDLKLNELLSLWTNNRVTHQYDLGRKEYICKSKEGKCVPWWHPQLIKRVIVEIVESL